jgi:Domain of unknown function (DUF4389)
MPPVTLDVTYTERRNRLTSAFRYILAIPHLIFAGLWGYAAEILALLQWFVILFTGRRNEGMWSFQRGYLGYSARVNSYVALLYDDYPNFGTAWSSEPVAFGLDYEEDANRLTNGLRFLWIIPALIIAFFLNIAAAVILIVSWFVIVITGKHPRGMFDFIVRVTRFSLNLNAYGLLMTDGYPKYEGAAPTSTVPPGDLTTGPAIAPPTTPPAPGEPFSPPSGPPAG